MAGDRPDWRKGTVAHRCTGGACPVSDVQDWNKVVMAYPPGDPQLTKDYEDWVHGTVYEEGSSACLYDCGAILVHDIGLKTEKFTDEQVITLTSAQVPLLGFMVRAAVHGCEEDSTVAELLYLTVDDESYAGEYYTNVFFTAVGDSGYYAELILNGAKTTYGYYKANLDENGEELSINSNLTQAVLGALEQGAHTFVMDGTITTLNECRRLLFAKVYMLYGNSANFAFGRRRAKGDGGITW